MNRFSKVIKDTAVLDRMYHEWARNDFQTSYQTVYRNSRYNQIFERYLYEQNLEVVQIDKKRYLRFTGEEEDFFVFLLTYG